MSDTSDLDAAVLARLDDDDQLHTLLPDGVFWSSAPQHARAFVVVTQEVHDAHRTIGESRPSHEVLRYIVLAVHQDESGQTAKAAASRILTLLDNAEDDPTSPLVVNGYVVMAFKHARRLRERYIDETTQLPWEYRGGIYELWAAPV